MVATRNARRSGPPTPWRGGTGVRRARSRTTARSSPQAGPGAHRPPPRWRGWPPTPRRRRSCARRRSSSCARTPPPHRPPSLRRAAIPRAWCASPPRAVSSCCPPPSVWAPERRCCATRWAPSAAKPPARWRRCRPRRSTAPSESPSTPPSPSTRGRAWRGPTSQKRRSSSAWCGLPSGALARPRSHTAPHCVSIPASARPAPIWRSSTTPRAAAPKRRACCARH